MCPKINGSANHQRGYLLPVAAFIVVAMGVLAVAISRTSAQTGLASAQELISTQTFYSAESGAQSAMSRLFANNDNRQAVDVSCTAMSFTLDFDAQGIANLGNCQVAVSCTCVYENNSPCNAADGGNYNGANGVNYSFYTINSVGSCGAGSTRSSRTVSVSAFTQ